MNKKWKHAITAASALAIATAAYGQGRHDDKPHGMPGKASAAPDTPVTERTPGRHDERPHGPSKKTKADRAKSAGKKPERKQEEAK